MPAAVERATKLASERGAKRAIMLPVSAPFHCSLMKPAQDRLAADLQSLGFQKPAVPIVCNVDAEFVEDADRARDALVRQVTGAVKWEPVNAAADCEAESRYSWKSVRGKCCAA